MPTRFKEFSFCSNDPGVVVARPYINSCVVLTFRLGKPNLSVISLEPTRAYPDNGVPINNKKLEDLKKLQKYVECNVESVNFYQEIAAWNAPGADNEEN